MKYIDTISNEFFASNHLICTRKDLMYVGNSNNRFIRIFRLNKKIDSVKPEVFFSRVGIDVQSRLNDISKINIYRGGEDEPDKGIIIHTADYITEYTNVINSSICMTQSMDIIKDIANGQGPEKYILVLGNTRVNAKEIESDFMLGAWINVDINIQDIINQNGEGAWYSSLLNSGIDPYTISTRNGQA